MCAFWNVQENLLQPDVVMFSRRENMQPMRKIYSTHIVCVFCYSRKRMFHYHKAVFFVSSNCKEIVSRKSEISYRKLC